MRAPLIRNIQKVLRFCVSELIETNERRNSKGYVASRSNRVTRLKKETRS